MKLLKQEAKGESFLQASGNKTRLTHNSLKRPYTIYFHLIIGRLFYE